MEHRKLKARKIDTPDFVTSARSTLDISLYNGRAEVMARAIGMSVYDEDAL
jgi:hypothetical protein